MDAIAKKTDIEIQWSYRTLHAKVETAINYGTATDPDWYMELRTKEEGYVYLKQRYDLFEIVGVDVWVGKVIKSCRSDSKYRVIEVRGDNVRLEEIGVDYKRWTTKSALSKFYYYI